MSKLDTKDDKDKTVEHEINGFPNHIGDTIDLSIKKGHFFQPSNKSRSARGRPIGAAPQW